MGLSSRDDAGVFQIADDLALVQTVDFFTPIVDDPYDYGQIAVANALSDIYAMGATPLTALNIVGFPTNQLDKRILADILRGGADKAHEAGVSIVGGHSIKDPELKYGMAVTALAHPNQIVRNNTARAGDRLLLTKPLGTGILTTALKRETLLDTVLLAEITASMKRLNRDAAQVMRRFDATACTDVTGFGLLGHLYEMTLHNEVSACIDTATVPLFSQVLALIEGGNVPGGLKENKRYIQQWVERAASVSDALFDALCDPQTSGGLLFTVPAPHADACIDALREAGDVSATAIGEMQIRQRTPLLLR